MTKIREFLGPWWTKLVLVICLTVITYASVSQTVLKLNEMSKGASDVCYGPQMITISEGDTGKTKVANAITNYLSNARTSSPFYAMSNPGMAFVNAGVANGVNPILLFAITESETKSATSTGASMSCGNPFAQRIKDADKTSKRWCCTGGAESCSFSNRWYVYSNGISEAMINEEASFIKTNYINKGITTYSAFLSDYGSSSLSVTYKNVMDQIIGSAGSALSCGVTTTSTTFSSTTTTSGGTPSCSFNPSSYSFVSGSSVTLKYSTVNATSAQICSSGGNCKTANTGSGQSLQANPGDATTGYTMTVTNGAKSSTCSASVTVVTTTTTTTPAPSCSFNSGSYSTTTNTAVNLYYNTYNATSVVKICSSGGNCKTSGLSTGTGQVFTATPTDSSTYTLTVQNAAGVQKTCSTKVVMPQPMCIFRPGSYTTTLGNPVTMYYSTTTDATSVKACTTSGSCKTGLSGGPNQSFIANPTQSTTYTMTVTSPSGTAACTAIMTVN